MAVGVLETFAGILDAALRERGVDEPLLLGTVQACITTGR